MKRSEMLSKLEQIFNVSRFPRDKKLTADLVLKEIEKFNMYPPDYTVNHWNNHEHVCHTVKRQWEPEQHDMEIVIK